MAKTIEFSCDDGHPLDLKVARVMAGKGIKGIFYVPIVNLGDGREVLNPGEIRKLGRDFEIGCHGYSHKDLTRMSPKSAALDVKRGKEKLESILGRKVSSFCPPKGKYNRELLEIARELGFEEVRSARTFNVNPRGDSFLHHPNLHIFPHTLEKDIRDCLLNSDLKSAWVRLTLAGESHLGLLKYLKRRLEKVHIWFHSWELEKYGLWDFMEKL